MKAALFSALLCSQKALKYDVIFFSNNNKTNKQTKKQTHLLTPPPFACFFNAPSDLTKKETQILLRFKIAVIRLSRSQSAAE